MNSNSQRVDFKTQWQRRQQWEEQAKKTVPDDKTFLYWAEKAQQTSLGSEENVALYPPIHRHRRWIPYAAAASLLVGVSIIGMTRPGRTESRIPTAEEVTVESQTIHFLCNNGCSAQDIMSLANKVIK